MKRFTHRLYLLAAISLGLVACTGVSNGQSAAPAVLAVERPLPPPPAPEQSGAVNYKSPEAAISAFMQGLAQTEIDKMLQACAVTEMGEKFNFDFYTERLGYIIAPTAPAPAEYALYAEMNQVALAAQILSKVKFFSYGLLSGETIDGAVLILDAEGVDRFVHNVDPARLATLKIEKMALPNAVLMGETRYQEQSAQIAKAYGAEAATERVLLFSFEGAYYTSGFTLLRYGESWKISDLGSVLANTGVLGVPTLTTVAEFDARFGGEPAAP
jgi:hypothetical protein